MGFEGRCEALSTRLDAVEDRMNKLEKRIEGDGKKIAELSIISNRLAEERENLRKRLDKVEQMTGAPPRGGEDMAEAVGEGDSALLKTAAEPSAVTGPLRIKILSGASDPAPAVKVAEELRKLGYKAGVVDRSSKPFQKTTVFYSSRAFTDALKIANILEGVVKPLTWQSEFDLIVVVVE